METFSLAASSHVLAALAADASWWARIAYQVNGLAVVFIALGLIWGVMEIIGWIFRLAARRATAAVARPGSTASAVPTGAEELPAETVAAIAAAVDATLGPGHVIHAIAPAGHDSTWAREGRREVFQSHKIR